MKGLVLLFFAFSVFGIAWRYMPEQSKSGFKVAVKENLLSVVLALLAVAAVVFFSVNFTMRLV